MCLSRAHRRPSAGHSHCFSTGWKDVVSESLVCKRRVCVVCVVCRLGSQSVGNEQSCSDRWQPCEKEQ